MANPDCKYYTVDPFTVPQCCYDCYRRWRDQQQMMRDPHYLEHYIRKEVAFRVDKELQGRTRVQYVAMDPMWMQEYPSTVKDVKKLSSGEDMNIIEKVKNLKLSAADKLLRKHGIVDSDGNLTITAQELLQEKVFEAYKDEIVADLKAVEASEKGKK